MRNEKNKYPKKVKLKKDLPGAKKDQIFEVGCINGIKTPSADFLVGGYMGELFFFESQIKKFPDFFQIIED